VAISRTGRAPKTDLALFAWRRYRQYTDRPARLVVVGMVANRFSIADSRDAGMLDMVGFDTATPEIISAFARGELDAG
jgi:60 kDa SS-A/Ro ribonucleoprotein